METSTNPRGGQNKYSLPLGARAGGLSYSAAVLAMLLTSVLASGIILVFKLEGDGKNYISFLASPLAIAVVLVLALTVAKQPVNRLFPLKTHPKFYAIGLLLIFGALFSLSWINGYIIKLFELMGYVPKESPIPDLSGWKLAPALFVIAVLPAVMEEILFRGIILRNAETEVGSTRAALITGFCFSLYHGSVEQTVYQFLLGCMFGFLAVRSRSIGPVVLIHFLNNAVIIILTACGVFDEATGEMLIPPAAEIALFITSAVSLVGGLVWLFLSGRQAESCEKGKVKTFFLWATFGIAVMGVMWIAGLFL